MLSKWARIGWLAGVAAWLVVGAGGIYTLTRYKSTPGRADGAPVTWPAATRVPRVAGRPSLVMFAHPLCPCTTASLGELERIVARTGDEVTLSVVFLGPGASSTWRETGLSRRARAIPGVHVLIDDGDREAERFGAATSGHVVVYGADGRLAFSGGITSARGHAGDNAGEDRVVAVLAGAAARPTSPVFGCALTDGRPEAR